MIIPILQQAKKIEIEYGPLYGRSKVVEEKHWKMFKYKDSNQMLEEDKLGIGRYTIHYSDIQKYTAKYYDSLWSHRRERLSAISSSAPGLLNSRRVVEALKPLGTILHQFFNSDFDGETGLPFKGALHLRKEELKKGIPSLLRYFLNNGLNGIYPSVGAATSIKVPTASLRKYAEAKLCWIDGGNTDNYGIGAALHNMQESGKYHPIMVFATMAGYNSISKYFSYKHNGEPNSEEAHGGFAGLIKFPLTDLRLFEGKAPVSPPDECVKNSLEAEKNNPGSCGNVFRTEGTYSIRENKFFGLKESEEKVRVIFVLYNERDMSLLPGENEKRKFVASAKQLVGVLEEAGLVRKMN